MTDSTSVTPTDSDLAFTRKETHGTIAEPAYAGALSFMRRRYTRDLAGADVAVMGVPFDLAVSGRSGARLGPRAGLLLRRRVLAPAGERGDERVHRRLELVARDVAEGGALGERQRVPVLLELGVRDLEERVVGALAPTLLLPRAIGLRLLLLR